MGTIHFPSNPGDTSTYTAHSGQEVTLINKGPDTYEVRLQNDPNYVAVLRRDGDFFDLEPAPGVAAVGGTGLDEADLFRY